MSRVPAVRKDMRSKIEKTLKDAGWAVQEIDYLDFSHRGVAVREVPLKSTVADYLLFVHGFPIGLVVFGESEGDVLSFSRYTEFLASSADREEPLRFIYLCTGHDTFFTDLKHPDPPARRIFSVHSPGTLERWYPELEIVSRKFKVIELLDYARKYRVRVVGDRFSEREDPSSKHQVTIVELPKSERREDGPGDSFVVNVSEKAEGKKQEATPVNVTVNITNPTPEKKGEEEKKDSPVKVFALAPESPAKKRSARKKKKRVFIPGPSVIMPAKKLPEVSKSPVRAPKLKMAKPAAKPKRKRTYVRPKKKIKISAKKRRRASRKLPLGIFGIFGTDKIRNISGEEREIRGGPGAYSALGARFFGRVSVAGTVGNDYSPPSELRGVEKSSLDRAKDRASPVTLWKHSKSSSVSLAPAVRMNSAELDAIPTRRFERGSQVLFLGNSSPESQLAFLSKFGKRPKAVIAQTASQWLGKKRGLVEAVLKKADAVLLTVKEVRSLTRERNLAKAVEKFSALGPKLVVVRQAEGGVLLYSEGKRFSSPAYPVKNPVDPSGTWEVFAGAFSGYLASKGRLDFDTAKRAVVWGEALSSFKKEGYGLERISSVEKRAVANRMEEIKKSLSV